METASIQPLLDQLGKNIDALEDVLEPLLKGDLSALTTRLPLLNRAKLHVLITYAIESILFSYLKLNGVEAKEHPVFRELIRVKQYYKKINDVESAPQKTQPPTLDQRAAQRFIKSALAGNEKQTARAGGTLTKFDVTTGRKVQDQKLTDLSNDGFDEGKQKDREEIPSSSKNQGEGNSRKRHRKNHKELHQRPSSRLPRSSKDVFQSLLKKEDSNYNGEG